MAVVKSRAVVSDRVQADGRRILRYSIVVEDNLGKEHNVDIGPKTVMPWFDESADLVSETEEIIPALTLLEQKRYLSAIREGENLFQTESPEFNTRDTLLLFVLTEALKLPAVDPLVINSIAFLELVTDEEMMRLFDFTQGEVDSVREQAAELKAAAQVLSEYTPILGG